MITIELASALTEKIRHILLSVMDVARSVTESLPDPGLDNLMVSISLQLSKISIVRMSQHGRLTAFMSAQSWRRQAAP